MIEGGWRRLGTVIVHEAGVSSARLRAWSARWLLGAGSCAMVLVLAQYLEAPGEGRTAFERSLREAGRVLGIAIYVALLWLFPWMTRGALGTAGRRGRLELLAASPLGDLQVFGALLGGRFLSTVHLLVGLAPAAMTFAWLGGRGAVADVVQVLSITLVAAWLTTSFACFHAILGISEGAIWTKLTIFITATPLAIVYGIRAGLLALFIIIFLSIYLGPRAGGELASLIFCAAFPFWTLGVFIFQGSPFGALQAAALVSCLILGLMLSLEVVRRFPRWLREREDSVEREDASYSRRHRKPWAAQRAVPSWEEAIGSYRRRRLSSMSRWVRGVYRLSGRSAYVVRELLLDDFRGEALGGILFVFLLFAWWGDLTFGASAGTPFPGARAAMFALVPCTFLAVFEGSRALPSRGTSALAVILSTPLTGGRVLAGSLLAACLRFRYALLAIIGMGLTVRDGLDFARALAFVSLFAALLALAHGIGLWARLLGPSQGGVVPLAVGVCFALGLGTSWVWPAGAPAHPIRAWHSQSVGSIFLSAGMVAAAAFLVGAAFALAFRRLAARGD